MNGKPHDGSAGGLDNNKPYTLMLRANSERFRICLGGGPGGFDERHHEGGDPQ